MPALNKAWPGVVEALDLIGSTQIQGRCSLAGNLCNASPAADSVPALYRRRAPSPSSSARNGQREVPVEQIPTGPGRTSLAKGEFILEFKLPPRPRASVRRLSAVHSAHGNGYRRGRLRHQRDAGRQAASARTRAWSLGAVAPTVLLVEEAAEALIGHTLDDATLAELDAAAQAACKPINDKRGTIDYRTKVAGVLARRVAAIAFDRAHGQDARQTH